MYEDAQKKLQSAKTPKQLADAIEPLLKKKLGPLAHKKLMNAARHAAETTIRPTFPSLPALPKDCDLKGLFDWCGIHKDRIA